MTTKEMIEVLQHYENGGEVEYRKRYSLNGAWLLATKTPSWNFNVIDYRIKEKPKTKVVYEMMFKHISGSWHVGDILLTETELFDCKNDEIFTQYQKTGRQWEVPND